MSKDFQQQVILGIDGSGNDFSVGISQNGLPIGNVYLNNGQTGSEMMLETIDRLLITTRVNKQDLQGVCVSMGPGSFTSVRISLSTAEAIGLSLGIPVYGVDSLVLIAATAPFRSHPVKVIQNAYKGELYSGIYDTSSGVAAEMVPIHLISPDRFYEELKDGDLVLGTGIEKLLQPPYRLDQKLVSLGLGFIHRPSGIRVIEQVIAQMIESSSFSPVAPRYIRESEAEINYLSRYPNLTS